MLYSFLRSSTFATPFALVVSTMVALSFLGATAVQESSEIEGNYSGYIFMKNRTEKTDVGLTVTKQGENRYEAVLYFGGLPWEQEVPGAELRTVKLHGTYTNYILRLKGDFPLVFQFIHNRFTALDDENSYRGHLEKVINLSVKS